jgi:hypothetical protein
MSSATLNQEMQANSHLNPQTRTNLQMYCDMDFLVQSPMFGCVGDGCGDGDACSMQPGQLPLRTAWPISGPCLRMAARSFMVFFHLTKIDPTLIRRRLGAGPFLA